MDSMLAKRPILVGALSSISLLLILRKHLLIGQFSFSLTFIGHNMSRNFTKMDQNRPSYRIGPRVKSNCPNNAGPSLLANKPILLVLYNPTFIGFKTSSYWSVQFFSLFSLVTIQVVNLLERIKRGLITLSDQTVLAVHSCNSWF